MAKKEDGRSLKEKMLSMYRDGRGIDSIMSSLSVSCKDVANFLEELKESNTINNRFSDVLLGVLADRVFNGIPVKSVHLEIGLSTLTITKGYCKFYNKETNDEADDLEEIDVEYKKGECPYCKKTTSKIDEKGSTYFCKKCNQEFVTKNNKNHIVIWQNID